MHKKEPTSHHTKENANKIAEKNSFNKQTLDEKVPSDVLGSYTGTRDKYIDPVQDADDL